MKYRENAQDTWHEINIKALDSMPIGTIVDYDGNVSDIPTGWEQYTSNILYNNSNGEITNITLSESTSNYTYIDIYFGKSSDNSRVQRFYDCNGNVKTLYTVGNFATTGVVLQELFKRIEFNGTSLTSPYGFYRNTSTDGTFSCVQENQMKIYKIIGYK